MTLPADQFGIQRCRIRARGGCYGFGEMESLINALELAATERPELLPWLLATSRQEPGAGVGAQLARTWRVRPIDLRHVALEAAVGLDRLEARRNWREISAVVPDPNLEALYSFAEARRGRVFAAVRQARLDHIGRKLRQALDSARQLQRIHDFIDGPAPAVVVDVFAFLGVSDRPRRE